MVNIHNKEVVRYVRDGGIVPRAHDAGPGTHTGIAYHPAAANGPRHSLRRYVQLSESFRLHVRQWTPWLRRVVGQAVEVEGVSAKCSQREGNHAD
jgi:hypothetical protein